MTTPKKAEAAPAPVTYELTTFFRDPKGASSCAKVVGQGPQVLDHYSELISTLYELGYEPDKKGQAPARPAPAAGGGSPRSGGSGGGDEDKKPCGVCGQTLFRKTKGDRTWYSRSVGNGEYCSGTDRDAPNCPNNRGGE